MFELFENLFKPRQRCLAVDMLLTSSVLSATSKLYFEQPAASFLVCSLIFIEYETKSQTLSPFIILQEDIVFNYSFSLTSYSLFLYPNVEKTALGTVFD